MKQLGMLVLALGLGLAACGGGEVATANKLKDKMCACTEQKCMDDLEKDAKAFAKGLREKYTSKHDVPKELDDAFRGYDKCRHDLRDKLEAAAGSGAATP